MFSLWDSRPVTLHQGCCLQAGSYEYTPSGTVAGGWSCCTRRRWTACPARLTAFKGRLLAGIEKTVRIYELGKKKLLRKCEHRK